MKTNYSLPPDWGKNHSIPPNWSKCKTKPLGWTDKKDLPSSFGAEKHIQKPTVVQIKKISPPSFLTEEKQSVAAPLPSSIPDIQEAPIISVPKETKTVPPEQNISVTIQKTKEPHHEETEKPSQRSSKKPAIIVSIIIVMIVVLALGGWAIFYFIGSDSQTQSNISHTEDFVIDDFSSENVEFSSIPSENSSSQQSSVSELPSESANEPPIDVSNYIGYWDDDSMERELVIYSLQGNQLDFSLSYYRLDGIEHCTATLSGNTASFSIDAETFAGNLVFDNSFITLNITESSRPFMPVESIVFQNHYDQSVLGTGFESEPEQPSSISSGTLTVPQAQEILTQLIPLAKEVEGIIYGSNLPYSETDFIDVGQERYYAVTDQNYQNIADIKAAVESVYTPSYAEERFYPTAFETDYPRYREQNGKLYVSPGGIGGGTTWNLDTLTIVSSTATEAVLQVEGENYGEVLPYSITIQKVGNNWRLNSSVF